MISKLTSEQEFQIKEYHNSYLSKGLSTYPSNKAIAEKAVKQMYKLMNEKEPKIVWVKSLTDLISFISSNKNSLWNSLRNSLRNSLWNSLENSLWNSLENSLWNSLENSLWNSLWNSFSYGQTNSNWISFYKYCNEVLGIKYNEKEIEKLNLWVDMMECSVFFVFKGITILMEHPKEIHVDSKGMNHNIFDYAIKWYDGTGIYVIHGEVIEELNIPQLFKDKKINNLEYMESKYDASEAGICPLSK